MDATRADAISIALAGADASAWTWDPAAPEQLTLHGAQGGLPDDLRGAVSDDDWQELQSLLGAALDNGELVETVVTLRIGDGSVREFVFRGGPTPGQDRCPRVTGVCWHSANAGIRTGQEPWAPLAKLSHELRSPLAAILHLTGEMCARRPPGALIDAINEVDRHGRYMLRVIEDMLDAFRSGESQTRREREVISTALLTDQLVPLAKEHAALQGIGFDIRVADDFPKYFWAESVALRRILQNLIDNALKFTQHGAVEVSLSKAEQAGGPRLYFDVADTGPGVAREEIERIFAPFEQGSGARDDVEGLGLGLALSRQLANALDGAVEIDSEPGRGSRFRLSIAFEPVCTAQREPGEATTEVDVAASPAPSVLLVEDHPLLSKHTGRELSRLGCCVDIAGNAQEALALLEQRAPDVVILDLDLPDMSGYDLCRLMLDGDQSDKRRYVAYSGADGIADRQAAKAAGFNAFFVKPSSARELIGL